MTGHSMSLLQTSAYSKMYKKGNNFFVLHCFSDLKFVKIKQLKPYKPVIQEPILTVDEFQSIKLIQNSNRFF